MAIRLTTKITIIAVTIWTVTCLLASLWASRRGDAFGATSAPLAGAAAAGLVTVVLIEAVRKLGKVAPGAAMGVVFSVMFALGVLLIEQAAADNVELDPDCVLYGQLETLAWFTAPDTLARAVFKAAKRRRNEVYLKPIWWLVMLIIRNIPEMVFKKLKI